MKKILSTILTLSLLSFLFAAPISAQQNVEQTDLVNELNEEESNTVLNNNGEVKNKIRNLESEGYEVSTDNVLQYEDEHYFIEFKKGNTYGLVEIESNDFAVFYADIDENFQVENLDIEKQNGETVNVEYDENGIPVTPDQNGMISTANACDWGIMGLSTAASAGYGAAFGNAFGPGVGTAVGAGVGLGISVAGQLGC